MNTTTTATAIEIMNGYVATAKFYDAKFTLEDCADGQFLTVYTKDRNDNEVPKVEIAVWTNPDTGRVNTQAQWLGRGIAPNMRIAKADIEGNIETAATEKAAYWV